MLGNDGGMRGKQGEGCEGAGNGRDAEGTYGGGALETDKATNTRTRALRGARKQANLKATQLHGDLTRHGTRIPVTVLDIHQRQMSV